MDAPSTLQEAIEYFADYQNCHDFLVAVRWPGGVRCRHCGSSVVRYMTSVRRWQCYEKHPGPQFSLKTGSVFEDSPIALKKWLAAMWLIVNAKNGISSYEIHRAIGVTQKSAWFMAHRIRTALHTGSFEKLLGDDGAEVEVDETFIGGKARNMHADVRARRITGRGSTDKTVVLGMLERGGIVTTKVVRNRRKRTLQREVKATVAAGAALYSDDLELPGAPARIRTPDGQPCDPIRRRSCAHQRHGELLVTAQAGTERNLRVGGALPPAPLPG